MTGPRRETGASALQRALASESAANLGRLGRAVERTLARLRATSESPRAAREDAEYACAEAVWLYFVQREACGLLRHDAVIESYNIPTTVLAKVGAKRPGSTDSLQQPDPDNAR